MNVAVTCIALTVAFCPVLAGANDQMVNLIVKDITVTNPVVVYDRTGEKLPLLKAADGTYTNVTVTEMNSTDIYFKHAGGIGNVKIRDLSPDSERYFTCNTNPVVSGNFAGEKFPVLSAGYVTYTNATITTVSATDVYFTYSGGMVNVKLKGLSPALQQHFKYDPKKADEVEKQQAENKLKYHDQLLHEPVVKPPDMTRDPAAAQEPAWQHNLSVVLNHASAQNKLVLLDFTGSDWSQWCIKLDQEVLGSPKFTAYVSQKLILVRVDFPQHTKQSEDLIRANVGLADHFKIVDYPTCILLDPSGKELGRLVGYVPGGPDVFIGQLERFAGK